MFGLELHPDKTRRIEFGRFAEENRRRRGEGKPETFDFLGFTHISGKNSLGRFMVRRTTIRKRMRTKLRQIQQQLRQRMHDPVPQTRKVAPVDRPRPLPLLRGTRKPQESGDVSGSGAGALVAYSSPQEPETPDHVDAHPCIGSALASSTEHASSLSGCTLCRHSSEIRTGCANKRPSGSVRGVSREWYPDRDRQSADSPKTCQELQPVTDLIPLLLVQLSPLWGRARRLRP